MHLGRGGRTDQYTLSFTLSLYKYFTYRLMWVDDAKAQAEQCGGSIGAGAPHGVLPIANLLCMPALNAFTNIHFLGGCAVERMFVNSDFCIFQEFPVTTRLLSEGVRGRLDSLPENSQESRAV